MNNTQFTIHYIIIVAGGEPWASAPPPILLFHDAALLSFGPLPLKNPEFAPLVGLHAHTPHELKMMDFQINLK